VINGETGFSYDENASASLATSTAEALAVYRQDPAKIRLMQKAAVDRIVRNHTWEKVLEAYLLLYRQAMRMSGGEH